MGKASRIRLLGSDYDKPREGPNALQLIKQRQKMNKMTSDMVSNSKFWSQLGLRVTADGKLVEP